MIYTHTPLTPKIALKWLIFSLSLNTFFAFYFWVTFKQTPFVNHFVFAQITGLTILNFASFSNIFLKNSKRYMRISIIFVFCVLGAVAGMTLASTALGIGPLSYEVFMLLFILDILIVSSIVGSLYYLERIAVLKSRLREEQIRRLDMEKKVVQEQFKFIQTQMEPHFLFNTLSSILTLLERDIDKAKSMQLTLIHYLRMSHSKFKTESNTIRHEIEMARTYLDILKASLGDELDYEIDIAEGLNDIPIPSMLIPSLVEKIAHHEFMQADTARKIYIRGELHHNEVRFEIMGTDIQASIFEEIETCLETIRKRLYKFFGNRGRLVLENKSTGILNAIMEFPLKNEPIEITAS